MRKGYILVVTMLVIAASMIVVTTIVNRAAAYKKLSRYCYAREKAKVLAVSGAQIALAQLGAISAEKEEQKQMAALLLLIDRKQTFTLQEDVDGIDGEIGITISSEQGKININSLYDFKEHTFVGEKKQGQAPTQQTAVIDGRKVLQFVCDKLQPKLKEKEVFGKLERFLKERKKPLIDPTELIEVIQFKKGSDSAQELRELFTIFAPDGLIQPLLIAPAVGKLLSLKSWAETEDARKKQLVDVEKKLKPSIEWSQEWNGLLGNLYGKEYGALPAEIRPLLQSKFESSWISVVSYGMYNAIIQKVCVVLEKEVSQQKDALPVYHVRRIYWL